jgi:hypothetical protein
MDTQSEQIVKHILHKREELGDNLAELETRLRREADWRTHFARSPWVMMGVSAVAGLLVSWMVVPARKR